MIFAEEIFDWTDNYTENLLPNPNTPEAKQALESIVSLWIQYATSEQNFRQWKKAVQVYDDALSDPVASRSISIYIAYAESCKLRGKISNAQKVYIKALTAGFPENETDVIWRDFLKTMKENGSTELTVDQLYAAVSTQVGDQVLTKPSANFHELLTTTEATNEQTKSKIDGEPANKRLRAETENTTSGTTSGMTIATTTTGVANNNSTIASSSTTTTSINPINSQKNIESISIKTEPRGPTIENEENQSKLPMTNNPILKPYTIPTLTNLHEMSTNSVDELLKHHSNRPTMLFRPLTAEDMKV